MDVRTKALMDFLNGAHSVFHAVAGIEKVLLENGYTCLQESNAWELVPGGKYYVTRGGSAVIAFQVPENPCKGFLMSASHADRPTFKVKENGEQVGAYTRLLVERYGGMLMAPWFDRPLSIAGRVLVETEKGVESKLVDIDRDLLMIPNVAIHMNRKANDGYAYNPAVDLLPLLGGKDARASCMPFWSRKLAVSSWVTIYISMSGKMPGCGVWRKNISLPRPSTIWSAPGAAPRAS